MAHFNSTNVFFFLTTLWRTVLPERYIETIEEVLSSSKAPKKEGSGYLYPVRGKNPFEGMYVTNGREAIRSERNFEGIYQAGAVGIVKMYIEYNQVHLCFAEKNILPTIT